MVNGRQTRIFLDDIDATINPAIKESEALQSDSKYEALKLNLQMDLDNHFANAKIHLYGSRIIGLATKESDLDIFIEIDNNFYSNKDVERDRKVIREVEEVLKQRALWKVDLILDTGSVPVIKSTYLPDGLKCDFIVSNGVGVRNSLMLGYLFDLQPEARKLYHFMRSFLPRYDVKFEGYFLKLLVIFYLQKEMLLPSIERVQDQLIERKINDWNVQFDKNRGSSYYGLEKMHNYKIHIPNFFQFYATFNPNKHVISIFKGREVPRDSYPYQKEISKDYLLCVFGPINKEHNLGKYVPKKNIRSFLGTCDGLFFSFLQYHDWHKAYEKEEKSKK